MFDRGTDDLRVLRGGLESATPLQRLRMAREIFTGSRHTKMQLSPLTCNDIGSYNIAIDPKMMTLNVAF